MGLRRMPLTNLEDGAQLGEELRVNPVQYRASFGDAFQQICLGHLFRWCGIVGWLSPINSVSSLILTGPPPPAANWDRM